MRRTLIGLPMASVLIANPAAAQDGGLSWLTGKWCAPSAPQGRED